MELFDLPQNLTVSLFRQWLSLEDLFLLDSAECNRASRQSFLEVLQSDGFVLGYMTPPGSHAPYVMEWMVKRKVKTRKARIQHFGPNPDPALIATFLATVSPTLADLIVINSGDTLLYVCCAAIGSCPHLEVLNLVFSGANACSTIRALISQRAPTLKRLAFHSCIILDGFPGHCEMPRLQYLKLKASISSAVNLCAFVGCCRNLLYFYWSEMKSVEECLHALAHFCPSLRALHYGYRSVTVASSVTGQEAVLHACQDLHTVNMITALGFSNAHVLAVVQHCRKLTGVRFVLSEIGISDESLAILCPRLSEMRHLSLVGWLCTSDAQLQLLKQNCRQLRSLSLGMFQALGSTDGALTALFSSLPFLEDLDLSRVRCLSDAVLSAIARHCRRLQSLDLYAASGFTEAGVTALAEGCVDLINLNISTDNPHVGKFGLALWRVMRPNLAVKSDVDPLTRWNNYRIDV
jgi:hypothetical protein